MTQVNSTRITIDHPGAAAPVSGDIPPHSSPATHRASAFDLVASQPWAITREMLETISAIARREHDGPEAVEARLGRPLQNTRQVTMRGDVAIVPLVGPVFRYANLFTQVSGATSLDVLATDFQAAVDDPAVKAIVLAIDSPGGQASGIAEFAALVRASSKPVTAYVDGAAASAAYWIAAAAKTIVTSKTGELGSIGAVFSVRAPDKANGTIEIVSSQSPKKRADVSTDEGRGLIQARADKFAEIFIADVAAFRGVSVEKVLADFGQGDMRMGADAVALGMADSVGTLEEVIAGLAGTSAPSLRTPVTSKGVTMNLEELRAAHPDLAAALVAEGVAIGATAERERIHAVEAQLLPGHEALITSLKADGKTTGAEAAVQVLAAERSVCAGRATRLVSEAPAPVAHAAAPTDKPAASDSSLPIEERAKATWDADEKIRAEFGQFDTYLAYAKAQAAGTVKVLSK